MDTNGRVEESPGAEADRVQISPGFPATLSAVAQAREWVSGVAAAKGHEQSLPTLRLLVSELATNAVRYADGDRFWVRFDAEAHLIVAVCGLDPRAPRVRTAGLEDAGGRGLALVDALSQRWGAQVHAGGKCVWFQLADDVAVRGAARDR